MSNQFSGSYKQHLLLGALCPFAASAMPRVEATNLHFDSEVERIVFAVNEFESRSELMDFCANKDEQKLWEEWRDEEITSSQLIHSLGKKRAKEIFFFIEYRQVVHDLVECVFVPSLVSSSTRVSTPHEEKHVDECC
eukprot:Protomagalhaensia_wolfi_Nauph_80__2539@NODE_269_length_2987_cov_114_654342_g201_i0_p3_GENE_NODE_269_length_2987_cov_114_654342_g201_i0NODE_269_length_2987_cov_114_654342_g201_i0_p3_ORF_typecomplete_len137_score21_41DUF2151/PF10221_9/0_07BBS1/PF14779_6/0_2_NODE_269_length_2987_cov_114_654342_g201_i086496